jgi:hypothetical protein
MILVTDNSWPPFHRHKYKLVLDQISDQTYIEILLYLSARDKCFVLEQFLKDNISPYIYETEIKSLKRMMWNLPSQYDLLDEYWYWYKRAVYINLQYTTFSKSSRDRNSRTGILINVREVIAALQKINTHITQTLNIHETHNLRQQYKDLYDMTRSAFDLWIEVAQKKNLYISYSIGKKRIVWKVFIIIILFITLLIK